VTQNLSVWEISCYLQCAYPINPIVIV